MAKFWRIYSLAWVTLIVAAIVTALVAMILPSHHDRARNPYAIEKIVNVELPEIASVESEDNLDRGTSRWDVYSHQGQFCVSLSEENISELERLCQTDSVHWRKNEAKGYYQYSDKGGVDNLYEVSCTLYDDYFVISYVVDESEGLLLLFPFLLASYILLFIGIVLAFVRGARNRRKNCQ